MSSVSTLHQRRPSLRPEAIAIASWLRSRLAPGAHLRTDSRSVMPGDAFFAWPGHLADGRAFLGDARARGAAALVVDDVPPAPEPSSDLYRVTGLRELAGEIAASWHGEPASKVQLIAVTGTNGKTSCSQWIAQGLARCGRRSAVIGTLGSGLVNEHGGAELASFGLTMPDALTLHALLADYVAQGANCVVMEASSIGLDQARLSGAQPAVAVFTNLSRDHLDYHGTEEAYAQAKLRLFQMPGLATAVLNANDPLSVRAQAALAAGCRTIAYGEKPSRLQAAGIEYLIADRIIEQADGMTLVIDGDWGRAQVGLPLLGRFNAINALAVLGAWLASGLSFDHAVAQLGVLRPVVGRLQRIDVAETVDAAAAGAGQPLVVIDYAHTPDALKQALIALQPVAAARGGRLWCVFGAGGDRDAGKRPLMGTAASAYADRIVLTSDNPRSEDPLAIIAAIQAGLARAPDLVEPDRGTAIRRALAGAAAKDVVLIAGKGHEQTQEIAGRQIPFSDADEARRALMALRVGASPSAATELAGPGARSA